MGGDGSECEKVPQVSTIYKIDKQQGNSTGNNIQYLIITYNAKNLKKNLYIYIYLNHFAVHLKLTQRCKSTIRQ